MTELTHEEEKDVATAARMLDKLKPNWYRRIIWKRLDMSDVCNCIAGQSGLDYYDVDAKFDELQPYAVTAPFAADETVPAWKNEVRKRRAKDKR